MQENQKQNITTIEFDVKVKTFDMNKGELIDAIAAGSKLTKADAGRSLDVNTEDTVIIRIEPLENENGISSANITLESHSKLTKADAGRNLDGAIESTK